MRMSSSLRLTSPAFSEGQIPRTYTCDGENLSPPVSWSGVPEGTESVVLVLDDPDAPRGTFTHWIVANIPPDYNSCAIPENVSFEDALGILEGSNDFGRPGYGGPCPPPGPAHNYVLRLYALDARLELEGGISGKQLTFAIDGQVLAEANLSAPDARAAR